MIVITVIISLFCFLIVKVKGVKWIIKQNLDILRKFFIRKRKMYAD